MSFSTTLLPTAAPLLEAGTRRICELCGDHRYKIVSSRDRHGQSLETAICMGCGLVAHLRIPSDAELEAYYTTQYRRQYHGEAAPSPRRVMRAWKNGQRILRQLDPFLRRECSVLEVGAGIGCTVKAFELGGHHATGIDLGLQFLQYGRNLLHAKLEKSSLFDLPPEPRFDLVCLVHVIEHFNSPTSALRAVHALVRPGGRLYVECPNLAAPFATSKRLFHFAHVYNFTPWTLLAVARKCGFEVEHRFSGDDDANVEMLLRRVDHGYLAIQPQDYERTIRGMSRYSMLTYHMRLSYLKPRLTKVVGYLHERLAARRFVQRLAERCLVGQP
jgi:SAM-dependent methyltransferase